jgi:hypothetical protein
MNLRTPEFPPIVIFEFIDDAATEVLIVSCGFEDRSLELLRLYRREGRALSGIVIFEYEPSDKRNRNQELKQLLLDLRVPAEAQVWLKYQRFYPDSFEPLSKVLRRFVARSARIVLDISGMSRLLIVLVLDACRGLEVELMIGYCEAALYHPTEAMFKTKKKVVKKSASAFLTGDVYDIVSALPLSTVTMQGHARLMIAFATFNPRELIALLNELSVQQLILIEGRPHLEKDMWRLKATQELNARVDEFITVDHVIAGTFDYRETLRALVAAYSKYGETHRILLAPIGSKLQAVAAFLSCQIWPDVQIVYPVAKSFFTEYTEGVASVWQIRFKSYPETLALLRSVRMAGLNSLLERIDLLESAAGAVHNT